MLPVRAWPSPVHWVTGLKGAGWGPACPSPHKAWVVLLAGLGRPVSEVLAGAACPASLLVPPEAPDLSKCQYLMRSSFESMQVRGSKETC